MLCDRKDAPAYVVIYPRACVACSTMPHVNRVFLTFSQCSVASSRRLLRGRVCYVFLAFYELD